MNTIAVHPNTDKRIALLDSFRFLAITAVVLFHYYSKWALPGENVLYPYADSYNNVIFENGFLGVEFFFIISGFVIAFTIEYTSSLKNFLQRRFIRLFPPLLICSVLTFLFIKYTDPGNTLAPLHNNIIDFIPSLSFTEPGFFAAVFGLKTNYIDAVYWSLAIEVRFYIMYGILYFMNREKATRNWCLFTIIIITAWLIIKQFKYEPLLAKYDFFNLFSYVFITRYLIYFTAGILFFNLYAKTEFLLNKGNLFLVVLLISVLMAGICSTELMRFKYAVLLIISSALFLIFIYYPAYLSFLAAPVFQTIGLLSYEIYLLHKNIGIALINYTIRFFGITQYQFIIPVIVYGIITAMALIIYRYYEKPAAVFLKRKLRA